MAALAAGLVGQVGEQGADGHAISLRREDGADHRSGLLADGVDEPRQRLAERRAGVDAGDHVDEGGTQHRRTSLRHEAEALACGEPGRAGHDEQVDGVGQPGRPRRGGVPRGAGRSGPPEENEEADGRDHADRTDQHPAEEGARQERGELPERRRQGARSEPRLGRDEVGAAGRRGRWARPMATTTATQPAASTTGITAAPR